MRPTRRTHVQFRYSTARSLLGAVALLCAADAFGQEGATPAAPPASQLSPTPAVEKWQTSWPAFVKELVSEAGGRVDGKPAPALVARFGSKPVTWEGTIDDKFNSTGSAGVPKMQVDPGTPAMKDQVILLHLKPGASQVEAWAKLDAGTKVRFRAKLAPLVYLTMGPTVNVMAQEAELLQ